jgi:hypothetical protein
MANESWVTRFTIAVLLDQLSIRARQPHLDQLAMSNLRDTQLGGRLHHLLSEAELSQKIDCGS